ncbi:AC4 [Papaya begomovirus 1]|nr:AC4 [Papaya begomovirus 1]
METLLPSFRYECSSGDSFRQIQREAEIIDSETLRRYPLPGTNGQDPLKTILGERHRFLTRGLRQVGEKTNPMRIHVKNWATKPN